MLRQPLVTSCYNYSLAINIVLLDIPEGNTEVHAHNVFVGHVKKNYATKYIVTYLHTHTYTHTHTHTFAHAHTHAHHVYMYFAHVCMGSMHITYNIWADHVQ